MDSTQFARLLVDDLIRDIERRPSQNSRHVRALDGSEQCEMHSACRLGSSRPE